MPEACLRHLSVVTLFPEMFSALTDWGVTGRAFSRGLCDLSLVNPRDYASDKHGTVDDGLMAAAQEWSCSQLF